MDYSERLVIALLLAVLVPTVAAFNLSPRPNIVIREPQLQNVGQPKVRSSYFGYTINMRSNSILVGAPRAQSNLPAQQDLNETGAIYKCRLDTIDQPYCAPYVIEENGNLPEGKPSGLTYEGEMRDSQWLGASMDGGPLETDQFVVCAPRMYTNAMSFGMMYQNNHGICYWTSETAGDQPTTGVTKIKPLILKTNRLYEINAQTEYFYMLGEQGISVHVTDNGKEILIGAPGISNWKGSVIRFSEEAKLDEAGLNQRSIGREDSIIQRHRRSGSADNYVSQVPDPSNWIKDSNAYFGYAVSSGYFGATDKLLYVASAPQANNQQGEVYVFDIVDSSSPTSGQIIRIYNTLSAGQMGEYFGYALVVDDFNGDEWPDIAVAAPFHTHDEGNFENGVVYVFLNDRGIGFQPASVLRSAYEKSGRFGSALSRLGDVNADGYNDLAVGAPYEENGAVYVFLGGPAGLTLEPSQKLVNPSTEGSAEFMFGHGLSKGSDLDGNQYLDLAVGDPGVESVFVYRAYPVGKIVASITPERKSLGISDTALGLRACWKVETKYPFEHRPNFGIEIRLDSQHGRITYNADKTITFNDTVGNTESCRDFEVAVTYVAHLVFRPVTFAIHFKVLDEIPDTEEFCTTCIAINPTDAKFNQSKVSFSTGCRNDPCVSDLRISSTINTPLPYVLGSSKSITLVYTIHNSGEAAFLTQLHVRLSHSSVKFMTIPSSCVRSTESPSEMLCILNNGSPLLAGLETTMRIHLDTSLLTGTEFKVRVEASSNGVELNADDNVLEDSVPLTEFSTLEIAGKSSLPQVGLSEGLDAVNLTHVFEVRNIGPSTVDELDVIISIPVTYMDPWLVDQVNVLEFKDLAMRAAYENRFVEIEWTQNDTILIPNPLNIESDQPIFSPLSFDYPLLDSERTSSESTVADEPSNRRRRSADATYPSARSRLTYNRYTRSVQETHQRMINPLEAFDHFIANLPENRTIYFECADPSVGCIRARFTVFNFRAGNVPIMVSLNLSVSLTHMDSILNEGKDIFLLRTSATIVKKSDVDGSTITVVPTSPYLAIFKYSIHTIPIWVYIVSALGGLLVLLIITYTMYKLGFFRREKKEELDQIKRKSLALSLQPDHELDD